MRKNRGNPMFDVAWEWLYDQEGPIEHKVQRIPDDLLQRLHETKFQNHQKFRKRGEYKHVTCVPALFVEKWLKEGFDILRASKAEIMTKLRKEGLDDFIVS